MRASEETVLKWDCKNMLDAATGHHGVRSVGEPHKKHEIALRITREIPRHLCALFWRAEYVGVKVDTTVEDPELTHPSVPENGLTERGIKQSMGSTIEKLKEWRPCPGGWVLRVYLKFNEFRIPRTRKQDEQQREKAQ